MTLWNAIHSGLPFRRPSWLYYATFNRRTDKIWYRGNPLDLLVSDAVADDWEVQEPKVEITREQFWQAYSEAKKEAGMSSFGCNPEVSLLAHKLFGGSK